MVPDIEFCLRNVSTSFESSVHRPEDILIELADHVARGVIVAHIQ
jgi:hypothetical protein